jgi:hypothetical protein
VKNAEEALDEALLAIARKHNLPMKKCRGHYHPGGVLVPLTEFHTHRRGRRANKPFSECKKCIKYRQTSPPKLTRPAFIEEMVPMEKVRPLIDELIRRVGRYEAARRAGLHQEAFSDRRRRNQQFVKPTTFARLAIAVRQAREAGEDNFDIANVRLANLIPNVSGLYGPKKKFYYWRKKREQERMTRAQAKPKSGFKLYDDYVAARNVAKPSEPDPQWWVHTGMEWLPRYGDEMLGSDF